MYEPEGFVGTLLKFKKIDFPADEVLKDDIP
jgi:hypothetical protein